MPLLQLTSHTLLEDSGGMSKPWVEHCRGSGHIPGPRACGWPPLSWGPDLGPGVSIRGHALDIQDCWPPGVSLAHSQVHGHL